MLPRETLILLTGFLGALGYFWRIQGPRQTLGSLWMVFSLCRFSTTWDLSHIKQGSLFLKARVPYTADVENLRSPSFIIVRTRHSTALVS